MRPLMLGLLFGISVAGFAQIGEKNFIDQNYIEVTGKAELEIVPDMIYLRIVLSDKENKDKLALPEIEKRMIDRLSAIGVDTNNDLSLADMVSNLKPYWLKQSIALTKEYQLIVRDSKTLQKTFSEFQVLGISNVSITRLDHSKIEQYRKEAKVKAIKAAKEKAELLAQALDQRIGKALYIKEVENSNPYLISGIERLASANVKFKANGFSADEESSDIEFEKIKIESVILVRFEL